MVVVADLASMTGHFAGGVRHPVTIDLPSKRRGKSLNVNSP